MSHKNGMYGYLAGITAAITLQPLQNIKIALMLPPSNLKQTNNFVNNFINAIKYLSEEGGYKSFYKGMVPNVVKTGFSSAIFFSSLRFIESLKPNDQSVAYSFLASSVGRVISAISSNPLQVVETRFQLAGQDRWTGGLIKNMLKVYKYEGIHGYFKGCLASCYKEGFFAGLYYSIYSYTKNQGLASIPAGLMSGIIATTITHPFQLIKAKLQKTIAVPIFRQLAELSRTGEAFRGLAPRLLKKPLSNTLAFFIFQIMEKKED